MGRLKKPNGTVEAHVSRTGRIYNGHSNKPVKYATIEEANAVKHANGPVYPGADGPSTKMLAIIQSGAILRPKQIAAVRQAIVNVVEQNLERASKVLANEEKWAGSQVQLFLGLLHKVAPTMSESLHKHTMQPVGMDYNKLTRVELEAALADVMNEAKVIDVPAEPEKPKREKRKEDPALHRRRNAARKHRRKAVAARYLEKPETILPPLTREQDDENRRQAAKSAKGLRKRASNNATMADLEAMASMDPIILGMAADPDQAAKLDPRAAAEKFLKTPEPDPE
jgi:hypothetical protein